MPNATLASVWESVMFAAHHQLANLGVIVDLNGQQAFGYTSQVVNLSPMNDRWRAFGWDVHDVDGHDVDVIARTVAALNMCTGAPHVLIAHTTFGKGVSFMERQIKWHYWPLSDEDYGRALVEIETGR
jgi:transketolase